VLGRVAKRYGDDNVLIVGIIMYGAGLLLFVVLQTHASLIVGTTLNAIGTAIFSNALPTVSSKLAPAQQRGLVLGVYQSTGSLARFTGPLFAGTIYAHVSITAPFAVGVGLLVVGLILALVIKRRT